MTVLFADVSGFTAMCEKMDPEEVHAVMNRLFEGLGKAIREEEGHIDKYIGDNVMALFGAPVAHEDDPFRACRAALGMQRFLAEFAVEHARKTGVTLRMRIGLHCGLVLAGGIGSEVKMDYSVLGDTVNLASRLESKAPPGGILISEELARRVRTMFEFGDVQTLTVKGKEKPVQAFVLKGFKLAGELPTGGLPAGGLRFVGRDGLLRRCSTILRQGLAGKPRVLALSGDLGIGKTRLMEEVLRDLGEAAKPLFLSVSADLGRRPFGVVRRMVQELARRAGRFPEDIPDGEPFFTFLADLGEELHSYREALWHLVAPTRLRVPVPDADPIIFRHTLECGVELLLEKLWKRDSRVTLVIDGFHLCDEASAEFFLKAARRTTGAVLPMMISTRSGVSGPAFGESIVLGPLEPDEAEALLNEASGAFSLPPERRSEVLERAAGNPLFIEELVQVFRQGGAGGLGGETLSASGDDGGEGRLPPLLRAAMMSRLDRLPAFQRGFLCYAAVQGVEFSLAGAARAAGIHEPGQVAGLRTALETAGVISEAGGGLWSFRQPLLREACYEALLKRDRRRFHLETAEHLVAMAGRQGIAPETLAYHFRQGEAWKEAAEASIQAAERANHLGLPTEAERWFAGARNDLEHVAGNSGAERALLFQAVRGLALIQLRRGEYPTARETAEILVRTAVQGTGDAPAMPVWQAEAERIIALIEAATGHGGEAEALLRRALERCAGAGAGDALGMSPEADVHGDLAELLFRGGRFDEARDTVARWRGSLAADDVRGRIRADTLEGRILYSQGSFVESLEHFRQARSGAERIGALSERARAGNYIGNAARDLGRHDEARTHFLEALGIWEKIQDAECIAGAENNLGNLAMSVGDWAEAQEHHQAAFQRWSGMGNVPGAAMAQANLAILAIEQGRSEDARRLADDALKRAEECGHSLLKALITVVQGEAALATGELERAAERFDCILSGSAATPVPLARFGAVRGKGRIALARQDYSEAAVRLEEARQGYITVKRAQEAARTVLWLAEAKAAAGMVPEALTLVEEARQQLTAIGACGDVARADALLATLRGGKPQ